LLKGPHRGAEFTASQLANASTQAPRCQLKEVSPDMLRRTTHCQGAELGLGLPQLLEQGHSGVAAPRHVENEEVRVLTLGLPDDVLTVVREAHNLNAAAACQMLGNFGTNR